jgi:hypothetical protein
MIEMSPKKSRGLARAARECFLSAPILTCRVIARHRRRRHANGIQAAIHAAQGARIHGRQSDAACAHEGTVLVGRSEACRSFLARIQGRRTLAGLQRQGPRRRHGRIKRTL